MKIGIISDTHDHLDNLDRALEKLEGQGIDLLCHLGDWNSPFIFDRVDEWAKKVGVSVKGVLGNNDGEIFKIVEQVRERWDVELVQYTLALKVGDKRVVLYHGTDARITKAFVKSGLYDVVLSGHTHEPSKKKVGEVLALNPGTLSGFSKKRGRLKEGELAVYDSNTHVAELLTFPTT